MDFLTWSMQLVIFFVYNFGPMMIKLQSRVQKFARLPRQACHLSGINKLPLMVLQLYWTAQILPLSILAPQLIRTYWFKGPLCVASFLRWALSACYIDYIHVIYVHTGSKVNYILLHFSQIILYLRGWYE